MIKLAAYSTLAGFAIMSEIEGSGYMVIRVLALFFLARVLFEAAKDRAARRHAR